MDSYSPSSEFAFSQLPAEYEVATYPSSASTSSSDSDDSYTAGTSLPSQYPTITLPLSNTRLAPMAYTYGDDVYASQYPPYSSTQQQQNWPTDAHAQAQNQVDGQHGPAALSYPQMTVHAPVPLSFSFPLLNQPQPPSSAEGSYTSGPSSPHQNLTLSDNYHAPPPPPLPYAAPPDVPSSVDTRYSVLEYYRSLPQQTFPTPSELLGELGAGAGAHKEGGGAGAQRKSDNQRKARQRAVAQSIGFQPTEPDTISSHDKKRHFLECLEHYIVYMHEQIRLVNAEPVQLERVSTYRGLSSRSMRTLLVHMEDTIRKRHEQTLDEEELFLRLRQQVHDKEEAEILAAQNLERRHSIANDEIGLSTYPPVELGYPTY